MKELEERRRREAQAYRMAHLNLGLGRDGRAFVPKSVPSPHNILLNVSFTYVQVYFLASQDALEVMRVTHSLTYLLTYSLTHSLTHSLSVSIDFTDVTLVSDDT